MRRMSLTKNDLNTYLDFAIRLSDVARQETLPRFRAQGEVYNKAGIWFDPVTDADREAERAQRRLIKAAFPSHGILGEEFGAENADAELRWVLDPIDGTRAFVCGMPSWTTLIALETQDDGPILSVVDQPFTDERWICSPEGTRYICKGAENIGKTSAVTELSKARLSTTDPRPTAYYTSVEARAFERVANQARLTRFSQDAYAYALLAIGAIDLVIEAGLQHHDYAALKPLVEGAGGVISDWHGQAFCADARGRTIAAATQQLHDEALAVLASDGGFS